MWRSTEIARRRRQNVVIWHATPRKPSRFTTHCHCPSSLFIIFSQCIRSKAKATSHKRNPSSFLIFTQASRISNKEHSKSSEALRKPALAQTQHQQTTSANTKQHRPAERFSDSRYHLPQASNTTKHAEMGLMWTKGFGGKHAGKTSSSLKARLLRSVTSLIIQPLNYTIGPLCLNKPYTCSVFDSEAKKIDRWRRHHRQARRSPRSLQILLQGPELLQVNGPVSSSTSKRRQRRSFHFGSGMF